MTPPGRISALDLATSFGSLRFWIHRHYRGLGVDLREELVAETALELVGRHRRNPTLRAPRWTLLRYAAAEAFVRVRRRAIGVGEYSGHDLELAVPPNQYDLERERERIADELVEDLLEELSRETPAARSARDLETRLALGTSPPCGLELAAPAAACGSRRSARLLRELETRAALATSPPTLPELAALG